MLLCYSGDEGNSKIQTNKKEKEKEKEKDNTDDSTLSQQCLDKRVQQ